MKKVLISIVCIYIQFIYFCISQIFTKKKQFYFILYYIMIFPIQFFNFKFVPFLQ